MDIYEIRKTRLNYVFKLFYPFITVLGALIVYFNNVTFNKSNYGEIIFLGTAAFLIVLLFSMIRYMFYEMMCLKTTNDDNIEITKVDNTYNNMFECFQVGGLGLLLYLSLLIAFLMYYPKGYEMIAPTKISLAISFGLSLILSVLPSDIYYVVSCFRKNIKTNLVKDKCTESSTKINEFVICLDKIKRTQWAIWSVFIFKLLFLTFSNEVVL